MTDHDRGAYAPHADAPLAFDARGPRDRGPVPMTLVASGVVLLVIVGALFLAYRGGVRGGTETPRPVGEPIGAIKSAPPPGSAASSPSAADPAAGLDVYAAQNVPNAKPTFAPPPEQPAPRAAPPAQLRVQAAAPTPVRIEAPEPASAPPPPSVAAARTAIRPGAADQPSSAPPAPNAAPATPTAADARPVRTASAAPSVSPLRAAAARDPAPAVAKPAVAKPAPAGTPTVRAPAVKEAAVAKSPAAESAASGGAAVQIGAFSSRDLADKGYTEVSGLMSGAMGGKGRHVEPVAHDGKTVFRTTITGFSDHAAAKAFCASLSAKGHTCFVKAGATEG